MSAAEQPRRLLGLLLIEMGVITPEQLEKGLQIQAETGKRLGEVLIERGFTSRLAIQDALAHQGDLFLESDGGYGSGLRAEHVRREGRAVQSASDDSEPDNVLFLHPNKQ